MFELVYLTMALLVGTLAINMRGGFLLYFVMALVLTPPGALLVMILMTGRRRRVLPT
ncbi:hypothetical protein [Paracraurococcus lichenis]|uniref:Uncharacterized protein n=1 Tax=Paracraurococcus lichenis TaxID=3064888 RepID=A0ABT9E9R9_9PROT|nr:hypothetical protein [Paracraurococcus sp. LOR1-02]MDO9712718.1 hypothetical protein [Paracraurococcus sp. LOR1-02]